MKMSREGRAALIQREGVRLKAYKDSVGIWTIGVGHTSMAGEPKVTAGLTITREECDEILSRDLKKYEAAVNEAVKVPLTQNQYDALVSLCFNIGPAGFKGSTVVRRLNGLNYDGAAEAILMWNKPPEIIGRRKTEYRQFLAKGPIVGIPKPPDIPKPKPVPAPTKPQPSAGVSFWAKLAAFFARLFKRRP